MRFPHQSYENWIFQYIITAKKDPTKLRKRTSKLPNGFFVLNLSFRSSISNKIIFVVSVRVLTISESFALRLPSVMDCWAYRVSINISYWSKGLVHNTLALKITESMGSQWASRLATVELEFSEGNHTFSTVAPVGNSQSLRSQGASHEFSQIFGTVKECNHSLSTRKHSQSL